MVKLGKVMVKLW